jgi:peptidyl-prolyl cis-trans isomerase C
MAESKPLAYPLLRVALQQFACSPAQLSAEQRLQAERIARRKLDIEDAVLASAEAAAVTIPPQQVDQAVNQITADFGEDNDLESTLLALELDQDALFAAVARELRVETVLERISANVKPVTDTDARLYYYMNSERFVRPEFRVTRHILITINPDFPENQREAALQRISQIARRLQKKPERFAEQALKHSECPTSLQGGLMGNVTRGRIYPELESVLFAMVPGQVSDPVESPLGFHVLLCDNVQPPAPLVLDDILPALRDKLEQQQRERAQKRWINELLRAPVASQSSTHPEGRLANG